MRTVSYYCIAHHHGVSRNRSHSSAEGDTHFSFEERHLCRLLLVEAIFVSDVLFLACCVM